MAMLFLVLAFFLQLKAIETAGRDPIVYRVYSIAAAGCLIVWAVLHLVATV